MPNLYAWFPINILFDHFFMFLTILYCSLCVLHANFNSDSRFGSFVFVLDQIINMISSSFLRFFFSCRAVATSMTILKSRRRKH